MNSDAPHLLSFLNDLRRGKVYYRLSQHRDDPITVEVSVPGDRWEVEFLGDGTVGVEVFKSDGSLLDAAALGPMLAKYADPAGGSGATAAAPAVVTVRS